MYNKLRLINNPQSDRRHTKYHMAYRYADEVWWALVRSVPEKADDAHNNNGEHIAVDDMYVTEKGGCYAKLQRPV